MHGGAVPLRRVKAAGYSVAVFGQKTYNGVAILSKTPPEDVRLGLEDGGDEMGARLISAMVGGRARRQRLRGERPGRRVREVRGEARLDAAAARVPRPPPSHGRAARPVRRLQRRAGAAGRRPPRGVGEQRAVPSRGARGAAPHRRPSASRTRCACTPRTPASTPGGTTASSRSRRTTACGSTSSWPRRPWRGCAPRRPSTATSARASSPPTTRRSWPRSTFPSGRRPRRSRWSARAPRG